MYSLLGLKIYGLLLLLCAIGNQVNAQPSGTAAFPLGVLIPTTDFSSTLTLTNKDDFGTVPGTSWTMVPNSGNTGSQGFSTQATPGSTTYANALQFVNLEGISSGAVPSTYSYTWTTAQNLGGGVRIVARAQISSVGSTGAPQSYIGWLEGSGANPKTYFLHSAKLTSSLAQGVGYNDPTQSPTLITQNAPTGFDLTAQATGQIIIVDIMPSKNVSWSAFDYQNQTPQVGLYKTATGASYNTITPASTGSMIIGGTNLHTTATQSITYEIDWIAQYTYAKSGSSFSICKALSIISLTMSVILFNLFVKL